MLSSRLRRCWCLWEMYSTIERGATLHITMPPSERKYFEDTLERNEIDGMMAKLSEVDVENAEAFDPLDKEMIHRAIREKLANGHADLNAAVKKRLREWAIEQARQVVAGVAAEEKKLAGLGFGERIVSDSNDDDDQHHHHRRHHYYQEPQEQQGQDKESAPQEGVVSEHDSDVDSTKAQNDVKAGSLNGIGGEQEQEKEAKAAAPKKTVQRWSKLRFASARLLREVGLQT